MIGLYCFQISYLVFSPGNEKLYSKDLKVKQGGEANSSGSSQWLRKSGSRALVPCSIRRSNRNLTPRLADTIKYKEYENMAATGRTLFSTLVCATDTQSS